MRDRDQNIMLNVCMAGVLAESALALVAMRPDYPSTPRLLVVASVLAVVVAILRGLAGRTPPRRTSMVLATAIAAQIFATYMAFPG